ncbi:PAS domain-containing protein, partial [Rhizobium sp. VS19-DR104.2]
MPTRKILKTADSKLKMIEESIGVGTWTWDLDTSEVAWSSGLCQILGVDFHTVIPSIDLYQSLVYPDDQVDFDDAIGIVNERRLENRKFRIIRPDGIVRWLQSKARPHCDRTGKTVMLTGVIRDVTSDEDMQAKYLSQKKSTAILTKLLGGWVWRAHPNGKLMETTHWTKLTGQTLQEAHDWDKLDAVHPDDRQCFRDTWSSAIRHQDRCEVTVRVRTAEGNYVTMHSRALPLTNVDGNILLWLGHSALVEEAAKQGEVVLLDSAQIRASRSLLNWTGPELATKANLSFSTVRRMEQNSITVKSDNLVKVRATFEAAGIMFTTNAWGNVAMSLNRSTGLARRVEMQAK